MHTENIKLSEALKLVTLTVRQGMIAEVHKNDQKSLVILEKIEQAIQQGEIPDLEFKDLGIELGNLQAKPAPK